MNYRDKAKQLHENVNHTYDGYNYVLHLDSVEAVHQEFKDELDFKPKYIIIGKNPNNVLKRKYI